MKTYNELTLAQELIKFQTIKTEDKGIMNFLSRKLSSIGFKCHIIKSKGTGAKPALNLYAKFGKSKPNINYLGHTDVVANLNNWEFPDEETTGNGCPAVMKYLKKKKEKIDFSIVGEPSSNKSVGDEIRIGRRGSMNATVTVYGKSGHSAFYGTYINPCTALAKIISKLKSIPLDKGTNYMPPSNLEFTKMNVDNISENVVPQSASAKFNVRFNSTYKSTSLKKKLSKIINAVAKKENCKTKIDYKVSGEAFYTVPNKEIYMVKKVVKKVTGNNAKLNCRGGTSDSRFLGSIPRLELGLRNNTIHMVNERTSISDLKKLTKIYKNILHNYFT